MDQFDQIKQVLQEANQAIMSGRGTAAIAPLQEAKHLLRARRQAGSSFSAIVTMQATLMSLLAGDVALAQAYAGMVVEETADELEKLGRLHRQQIKENQRAGKASSILCK